MYQIETVPVPILDLNKKVQSYTHLQVNKPYIAPNSETYISMRNQKLRTCKNIGYEVYCEECFLVKHKSKYSCESAFYFNLGSEIIKENFASYFNNTNIKPTVLDGGNEIILAIEPNDKHTECKINNYIPVRILSFPYVLLNRSVLCNCEIEAENHFLLEMLAAHQKSESKLTIYFTVNLALANYFDNLTKCFPILSNRTTYKQILPISLETFDFESELLKAPMILKDLFNQITHKQEMFFHFQERHTIEDLEMAKKHFLFDNHTVDIFLFVAAITLLLVTIMVLFICKHTKLKSLITSLALQKIREVGTVTKQEHFSTLHDIECTCKIQLYTMYMLIISLFGIAVFILF